MVGGVRGWSGPRTVAVHRRTAAPVPGRALQARARSQVSAAVGRTARPGLWPLLRRSAAPMGQPGLGWSHRGLGALRRPQSAPRAERAPYLLTGARGASTRRRGLLQTGHRRGATARLTATLLRPSSYAPSPALLEPSGHRSLNRSPPSSLPLPLTSHLLSPHHHLHLTPPPTPFLLHRFLSHPTPFSDHHHTTHPFSGCGGVVRESEPASGGVGWGRLRLLEPKPLGASARGVVGGTTTPATTPAARATARATARARALTGGRRAVGEAWYARRLVVGHASVDLRSRSSRSALRRDSSR